MIEQSGSVGALAGLAIDDLVVRYGGHTAVDGVTLDAPGGRVTALIGPNGAGKTTIFNACTGLVRPAAGKVSLFGADITTEAPERRARLGLGRTYQRMQLFDSLSVRSNVVLGAEAGRAGANPLRHLLASRQDQGVVEASADRAMADCGLDHLASARVGTLPTGQRRLVELARVLAGDFRILLLDEPSSGLDASESEAFGLLLRRVVDERDVGLLLVEHDMSLVLGVADHVWVLDFGTLLFAGSTDEVRQSAAVQAAYLGTEVA